MSAPGPVGLALIFLTACLLLVLLGELCNQQM